MEKNNFSPNQLGKSYHLSNNYKNYTSKSNIAKTLQEENFIPFDNIDPDSFINLLDEDTPYHIIDSEDVCNSASSWWDFGTLPKSKDDNQEEDTLVPNVNYIHLIITMKR